MKSQIHDENELYILAVFGETSIASSKFWFENNSVSGEFKSEKVKADGKGAASASVTWAVGAAMASGPVAPVTYLVSVGLGAALASIMADDNADDSNENQGDPDDTNGGNL